MTFSKKGLLVIAIMLLSAQLAFATGYGSYELQRAKSAMDQGDYRYAIRSFRDISLNYNFSDSIRREAAYFIGFCHVKMSDPWGAINAYREFLDRYDNANGQFVPDAMYVLGRTYEEVGQPRDAAHYYRRCQERYPHSEFARKSADRLRILGYGSGGNGGHGGHGGDNHAGVSPEIRDIIELARLSNNSYTADQMLLKGATKARSGADFIALCKAIQNDFTRGQVFDVAKNSREFAYIPVFMIVQMAKTSTNSYTRDQLLLAAAQKVARTTGDFRELAEATSNTFTRNQILQIAQDKIGGHHYSMDGISASMEMAPEAKPAKAAKTAKKADKKTAVVSDPFDGFSFDTQKIERATKFMDAVKSRKNMDETFRKLQKDDLSMETLQESVKEYQQLKKFDNLHEK